MSKKLLVAAAVLVVCFGLSWAVWSIVEFLYENYIDEKKKNRYLDFFDDYNNNTNDNDNDCDSESDEEIINIDVCNDANWKLR
eukprot:Pgem_evm1s17478